MAKGNKKNKTARGTTSQATQDTTKDEAALTKTSASANPIKKKKAPAKTPERGTSKSIPPTKKDQLKVATSSGKAGTSNAIVTQTVKKSGGDPTPTSTARKVVVEKPKGIRGEHEKLIRGKKASGTVKSQGIRGVQGSVNSCYMDSSLNSMFLFNEDFLKVLENNPQGKAAAAASKKKKGKSKAVQKDSKGDTLRDVLQEEIAKPLNINKSLGLTQGTMPKFRSLLSHYKEGYIGNEMDSEEFISTLFGVILKTPEFYFIDGDDEGSYVFQTYADMTKPTNETDVQGLLEYSFGDSDIQLAKVPKPGFIIKMPVTDGRHMFGKIFPNPTLKLGNILKNGSNSAPEMLLSAVICLSGNHYTAFVREGKDKGSSSWYYLDSFAWSDAEHIPNLDKSLVELRCSQKDPLLIFLTSNCYMCFYSPINS